VVPSSGAPLRSYSCCYGRRASHLERPGVAGPLAIGEPISLIAQAATERSLWTPRPPRAERRRPIGRRSGLGLPRQPGWQQTGRSTVNVRGDVYWPPTRRSHHVVETPRSTGHRRHQFSQVEASQRRTSQTGASGIRDFIAVFAPRRGCHVVRAVAGCGVGNSPSSSSGDIHACGLSATAETASPACQIPLRILRKVVTAGNPRSHVGSILDGSIAISASDKSPHLYNGVIRPPSRPRPPGQIPRRGHWDQRVVDT